MGSQSILFRQCSYPVILGKVLTELQVIILRSLFFSGGFNSRFGIEHSPLICPMLSHAGAPLNHPLLTIPLFQSAEDISKIRVSTLHLFKFFQGCYLIQAI